MTDATADCAVNCGSSRPDHSGNEAILPCNGPDIFLTRIVPLRELSYVGGPATESGNSSPA